MHVPARKLQSFFTAGASAQCNPADLHPVAVAGISVTDVSCPQNGAIAINGVTGGGGEYVYEIFSGPVLRGIQSQNIFAALLPGKYRVRITGCNGVFLETDTITVGNLYLEPSVQTMNFISSQSFKCNTTNTGKVKLTVTLSMPNNTFSDTQFYKLPLRYQVSTNGDPATGFTASPFTNFPRSTTQATTYSGGRTVRSYVMYDTLTGLNAGTTYYVRVTDGCGIFKTTSVTLPAMSAPVMSYDFQVKEPYIIDPFSTDFPQVRGNCIQWGELSVLLDGVPTNSLSSSNTYLPIKAVLKRQDDGTIIDTRTYGAGTLIRTSTFGYAYSNSNNRIFDSVPRVPVRLELTDACGTLTAFDINSPSPKVPFKLQANAYCGSGSPYFYINTINAAPSLPIRFKLYDASNTLLADKLVNYSYQYVALPNNPFNLSPVVVPSFGEYRIVYEDQCGISDSLVFNFNTGGGVAPEPSFNFTPYSSPCSDDDGVARFTVDVQQTNVSPASSILIVSGPAGINYPVARKFTSVPTGSYFGTQQVTYFDSLIAGTYMVEVKYGCNQVQTAVFTISGGTPGSYGGVLSFTEVPNDCSSSGTEVYGTATITGANNLLVNDQPCIRFLDAPLEFLKSISRSKNGSDPQLPFDLGKLAAYYSGINGIDTNTVQVYPLYTYSNIMGGGWIFPQGNYTVQIYGKCTGSVYDTKSFAVTNSTYSKPNLGASSGYICTGGSVKVVASPIGGRHPFLYQIKLASDPDESNYSVLQSDSIFTLPPATPAGTVYVLRTVDACNNSFVGQVVVNSFTGTLYVAASNDCIGVPSRIITGYIPGGIYTWVRPDGSVMVTNSNELYIPSLAISDIGIYTVMVTALDGCISTGAANVIGSRCYIVLPLSIINFDVKKINARVMQLRWEASDELNVRQYEMERSNDGMNWITLGVQPAKMQHGSSKQQYLYEDILGDAPGVPVLYYRVKQVGTNDKVNYTPVKKVYFSNTFSLIRLYPSPFTHSLGVEFISSSTEKAVVTLHDMSGREVSLSVMPVVKGVNHYQYTPVLSINPGTYILTLTQGANKFSSKVVKGQE